MTHDESLGLIVVMVKSVFFFIAAPNRARARGEAAVVVVFARGELTDRTTHECSICSNLHFYFNNSFNIKKSLLGSFIGKRPLGFFIKSLKKKRFFRGFVEQNFFKAFIEQNSF